MRNLDIPSHTCEEANMFGVMRPGPHGPEPVPCGQQATKLVWHYGRKERPYFMCDGCADHNIRNRGGISLVQEGG